MLLTSLSVVCQTCCLCVIGIWLLHPRLSGHSWEYHQGILLQRQTARWERCSSTVLHQAFAKQACSSISRLSKEVVPGCAIQLGQLFGHGGPLPVRAAKTSTSQILMRLPPSASIDCVNCVSKLVAAKAMHHVPTTGVMQRKRLLCASRVHCTSFH